MYKDDNLKNDNLINDSSKPLLYIKYGSTKTNSNKEVWQVSQKKEDNCHNYILCIADIKDQNGMSHCGRGKLHGGWVSRKSLVLNLVACCLTEVTGSVWDYLPTAYCRERVLFFF